MFKKIIGYTILVAVIGVLAFGAINRTSAKAGETLPAADVTAGYGNGYGNGWSESDPTASTAAGTEVEEHSEEGFGYSVGEPLIDTMQFGDLSQAETDGLLFMYEEEKLARDVYTFFATLYTQPMFSNIARSEQTHMDSVNELLERYNLDVPVADTAGVFNNADLQQLYTDLTASGAQSLADALLAGAVIEEIDILDLKVRLEQVDQPDIQQVYQALLYGSYNHLNAFSSLYFQQTGVPYEPQSMSESDWADYQAYLAENGLYYGGNGRGRGNGGGGGGRR